MAEAKRDVVKQEVVTVVETPVIDLRLSIEEAQFLQFIMDRIGGDHKRSRRRHAEAINKSLRGLVPVERWSDKSDVDYEAGGPGSIYFHNEEAIV